MYSYSSISVDTCLLTKHTLLLLMHSTITISLLHFQVWFPTWNADAVEAEVLKTLQSPSPVHWTCLTFHIHLQYSLSELCTFCPQKCFSHIVNVLTRCICSPTTARYFFQVIAFSIFSVGLCICLCCLCLCTDCAFKSKQGALWWSWIVVNVWHDGCLGPMLWKTWFHFTHNGLASHPLDC